MKLQTKDKMLMPCKVDSNFFALNIYLVLLLLYCISNFNLSDLKWHLKCNYVSHNMLPARGEFI